MRRETPLIAAGTIVNRRAVQSVGGKPFYMTDVRPADDGAWIEVIDPDSQVAVHFKFTNRTNAHKARQIFLRAFTHCSIFSGYKEPKTKKNYQNAVDRMTIVHESGDGVFAFTILNADNKAAASLLFMKEDHATRSHELMQGPLSACIDVQCGGFSVQTVH